MCRISMYTKNDQFQYTIFYAEITKPNQKNSHMKFIGILFIVILAICVHFRAYIGDWGATASFINALFSAFDSYLKSSTCMNHSKNLHYSFNLQTYH